jgi:hypothetical protein
LQISVLPIRPAISFIKTIIFVIVWISIITPLCDSVIYRAIVVPRFACRRFLLHIAAGGLNTIAFNFPIQARIKPKKYLIKQSLQKSAVFDTNCPFYQPKMRLYRAAIYTGA